MEYFVGNFGNPSEIVIYAAIKWNILKPFFNGLTLLKEAQTPLPEDNDGMRFNSSKTKTKRTTLGAVRSALHQYYPELRREDLDAILTQPKDFL